MDFFLTLSRYAAVLTVLCLIAYNFFDDWLLDHTSIERTISIALFVSFGALVFSGLALFFF
jgi:hypothetical protein